MDTDFVAIMYTSHSLQRPIKHVGSNVEQGSLPLILLQEVVERIVRAIWPVVVRQSPGIGFRACYHVVWDASMFRLVAVRPRPPAVGIRGVIGHIAEIT